MMAQRLHVSAREMPGESLSMQSRSQVRARRYVARMVVAFVVGKYGERVCPAVQATVGDCYGDRVLMMTVVFRDVHPSIYPSFHLAIHADHS